MIDVDLWHPAAVAGLPLFCGCAKTRPALVVARKRDTDFASATPCGKVKPPQSAVALFCSPGGHIPWCFINSDLQQVLVLFPKSTGHFSDSQAFQTLYSMQDFSRQEKSDIYPRRRQAEATLQHVCIHRRSIRYSP